MRILTYLSRPEAKGGVELSTLQISRELTKRGHAVDLCYAQDGNLAGEYHAFCERMMIVPAVRYTGAPVADLGRVLRAAKRASGLRPDVIYLHHVTELAWAVSVQALTGAPIVCHLHDFVEYRPGSFGARMVPLLAGRVHRFVSVSDFIRGQWQAQSLERASFEVIPNGVSLSEYPVGSPAHLLKARGALGLPADAYVALYMGRIVPEKGVDLLLEAWRRLNLSPDRGRLLIVGLHPESEAGSGYEDRLQRDSPAGTTWLPMRRNVVDLLHAADVVVLPARWEEPFGRVVLEGMATGRPVVAASAGGIPEILGGEFSRFLFPRENVDALSKLLHDASSWRVDDPGLAERCVEHVAHGFSLETTAARMEAALQSALGSRRRSVLVPRRSAA